MGQPNSGSTTWAGLFMSDIPVPKNPKSRWYTHDQYAHDKYPPYACGAGYYLGKSVLAKILDKHRKNQLNILRVEDASIGVWLDDVRSDVRMVDLPISVLQY